jgi:hypothetical protein
MLTTAFHQGWENLLREIIPGSRSRSDITPGRVKSLRLTLESYTAGTRHEWALAVFSDASRETLTRYFTVQQRWLAGALDRLQEAGTDHLVHIRTAALLEHTETCLGRLLLHLRENYPELFNEDLPAPAVIRLHVTGNWQGNIDTLKRWVQENQDVPTSLVLEVVRRILSPSDRTQYTYRTLYYLTGVLNRLADLPLNGNVLPLHQTPGGALLELNFNHLEFFAFCRQQLLSDLQDLPPAERIAVLNDRRQEYRLYLEHRHAAYDPAWPPVGKMLYEWTGEELAQIREAADRLPIQEPAAVCKKLMLNLPAAYLACLIRLGYQGNWSRDTSLTDLFKFAAAHFESRRMEQLSWRSLSKEYYSINQTTAARVRDLLQQMISLLNRLYFPVWAAGYVLIHGG